MFAYTVHGHQKRFVKSHNIDENINQQTKDRLKQSKEKKDKKKH